MDDADRLAEFFGRLAEDAELYNDYLTDPLATMRAAGISEDLIAHVLQGNLRHLTALFSDRDAGGQSFIFGTIIRG